MLPTLVPMLKGISICLATALAATTACGHTAASSRLDSIQRRKTLTVCSPGDYHPFSLAKPDGTFEGLDIDLVRNAAAAAGATVRMVKSSWPTLVNDLREKCDVAVGGISVTLQRQTVAFFTVPYMVNGKAPITKCENADKFQTVADIDKPTVTVIENPGGSNERFARDHFKSAKIVLFDDNTTIFDQILNGTADVMISESVETIAQQKLRPGLCAVNPDMPLQYGEMAWLLPRGDSVWKAWLDQWFHLAKATGDYDRIAARWLPPLPALPASERHN